MGDVLQANQAVWRNTVTTFKSQFTRLDKLINDAKLCANNLTDAASNVSVKDTKKLVDPLKRKLELVNNYVTSLHTLLPSAAGEAQDPVYNVERLTATLTECMDRAEAGNLEFATFLEIIADMETADAAKESKPTKAGTGASRDTRAPEIKGVATALKPEELTSSIAAHDISIWVEQWSEFKDNSSFCRLGEASTLLT